MLATESTVSISDGLVLASRARRPHATSGQGAFASVTMTGTDQEGSTSLSRLDGLVSVHWRPGGGSPGCHSLGSTPPVCLCSLDHSHWRTHRPSFPEARSLADWPQSLTWPGPPLTCKGSF